MEIASVLTIFSNSSPPPLKKLIDHHFTFTKLTKEAFIIFSGQEEERRFLNATSKKG